MAKIQSNKKLFLKLGDIFGISMICAWTTKYATTHNKLIFVSKIMAYVTNMSTKPSFEAQNTVKSQNINIFCN